MRSDSLHPIDRFVQAGDIKLHYADWGENGPPIILLHGGRITGRSWDATARGLAPDYHVISLDARGHGDSDKPSRGYTYVQRSQDLEMFLEVLGINSSFGMSHSTGAVTMAIHELKFPGRFRKIILIEPPVRPRHRTNQPTRDSNSPRNQRRNWPNRLELDSYLSQHPRTRRWTEESRRAVVEHGVTELQDGSVEMKWTLDAYNSEEMVQNDPKLIETASGIHIPNLLIYGTNGIGLPNDVEELKSALPNSDLIWINEAGHNVYMEEPETVINLAKSFFKF